MMTPSPSPYVVVAKIIKAHGIRGEVVLESHTDVPGRLENTATFVLTDRGKAVRTLHVESHRFIRDRHMLKFAEFETRSEAEEVRDMELAIPEEQLGELSSGQFFIHKLQGMSVRLRNGTEIGTVRNVVKTKGVDLLEIGEKGEVLIPFTDTICVEVDEEKRRITIDPPEGLLQLNAR